MKVIATNLLGTVSASNANANYPDDNLLDKHPKKIWKSTGFTADLTFTITGGLSNSFALFNTNAQTVSFLLQDPNIVDWEPGVSWEPTVSWARNDVTITETTNLDGINGSVLAEWEDLTASLTLIVSISRASDEILFAGVGVAGNLLEYNGPSYGFNERGIDYSIVQELSNNAIYVKDRDQVRAFSIDAVISLSDYNVFLGTVWKTLGSNPTAWVVTNTSDARWLVYAMFTRPPRGRHLFDDLTRVNFEITEVL